MTVIVSSPAIPSLNPTQRRSLTHELLDVKDRCDGRAEPFKASFILLKTNLRGMQAITGPLGFTATGFLPATPSF
ncbi:hypothetical protein V6N13_132762 [Hibiscus sabdariffa]